MTRDRQIRLRLAAHDGRLPDAGLPPAIAKPLVDFSGPGLDMRVLLVLIAFGMIAVPALLALAREELPARPPRSAMRWSSSWRRPSRSA